MQVFNEFLVQTLREMGHFTDYIHQNQIYTPQNRVNISPMIKVHTPAFLRQHYDLVILSGSRMNYRDMFLHFRTRTLVWTHGQHVSPLNYWDGAEAKRPGNCIVATNEGHMQEARLRGIPIVKFDMPVQFQPREVKPAGDYAIAVGTLEARKQYEWIAAVAEALQTSTLVYGSEITPEVKRIVDESPFLRYEGVLPHDELLDKLAGAKFLIHGAEVEGRPTATLEAMGLGVPIIARRAPLYMEYVDPGKNLLRESDRTPAKKDITPLLKMSNRRALADETHNRYGLEVTKEALAGLLAGL
jgi:glycosyltransferase involved in cell wall biosynthesis